METDLSKYLAIPTHLIAPGRPLGMDLYIFFPKNQAFVRFRQRGDVLSEEDCGKLRPLPKGQVLALKQDYEGLISRTGQALKDSLKGGDPSSPEAKEAATELLSSIDLDPAGMLDAASKIVQEMMLEMKKAPGAEAYEQVMRKVSQEVNDPLAAHDQQVSAISVLMLMTLGNTSMTELSDLASAGLIHDLGLKHGPIVVLGKYLSGKVEEMNSSEQVTYLRHPEVTLEVLCREGVSVSPGMKKIVECHHESFDGSGFRGMRGPQIPFAARVFRIADDIVQMMNSPESPVPSFRRALGRVNRTNRVATVYDPQLLFALCIKVVNTAQDELFDE